MRLASNFSGKTCLVTGSTGFLGPPLVSGLTNNGAYVRTLNDGARVDITSKRGVAERVHEAKPYFVFHLAAKTALRLSWKYPQGFFRVNVDGTRCLLDCIRSLRMDNVKIMYASSSSVYGRVGTELISEEEPIKPVSPYGITKACAEAICRGYWSSYGTDVRIARPFYVSGYGCNRGVIFETAMKIATAERNDKPAKISLEDPSIVIDVVDVRDCVTALETVAALGQGGEAYNVCTGEGHSIGEIAEILISASRVKLELATKTGKVRPVDMGRLVGDPDKLIRLGWSRRYSIRETLNSVLDYCHQLRRA